MPIRIIFNKPKMVTAPEGLNQVILRKVSIICFPKMIVCQKQSFVCQNNRFLPKIVAENVCQVKFLLNFTTK